MNLVKYSAEEAAFSLWRRRGANALALLTIAIALFVLGGFLLINVNVQRWVGQWTAAAELSVYLDAGVSDEDRTAIASVLDESAAVADAEFVGQEEALRRFHLLFPDLADAAAQLGDRPLPASFEVHLQPGRTDEAVEALAADLAALPGVSDVRYDRRWLDRLTAVVETGRALGAVLAAVLVLAAALTVASVIRLALHARQQEVEIMQLVGAPLGFIRGPFVLEGVLQGAAGAVIALAALYAAHAALRAMAGGWLAGIAGPGPSLTFLPWTAAAGLVLGGMAVGCMGGLVAARAIR